MGGFAVLAAAGEDDSFKTGFGLASTCGELFVKNFESRATNPSGVHCQSDRCCEMACFKAINNLLDALGKRGVGEAEGEDKRRGELPGIVTGVRYIDPVVGRDDLLDVEEQGQSTGVFGLAKIEAEDGLGDFGMGHDSSRMSGSGPKLLCAKKRSTISLLKTARLWERNSHRYSCRKN